MKKELQTETGKRQSDRDSANAPTLSQEKDILTAVIRQTLEEAKDVLGEIAEKGWCCCNIPEGHICTSCRASLLVKGIDGILQGSAPHRHSDLVQIIVNCKPHTLRHGQRLTYEDVFRMAFDAPFAGRPVTMTCSWEGSGRCMVPGKYVNAEHGMIFNVVDTSNA